MLVPSQPLVFHLSVYFRFDLYIVCICVVHLCIATEDDCWRVVEMFGFHLVILASVWFNNV